MIAPKSLGPPKDRPTLLMVGRGEPMDAALRVALDRHGLFVEESSAREAANAVRTAAPDLVLLVGDASKDGGRAVLEGLSGDVATSVVPVALLSDEGALDKRLLAFRYGAIAAVPRSASADEVARRVAQLARELPERSADSAELGEATFDELVSLVTRELRSGILTVGRQGAEPMRIVLGAGRPVAEAVHEFVERLRPLVSRAEPLSYEFHKDGAGGSVGFFDAESNGRADLSIFEGLRVLVVDNDPARADALAQELRARKATVAITDTAGRGLERAAGLDPEIVVVDALGIEGPGFEVVRQLRRDVRLRWASILVAPWEELWPDPRGNPDVERLADRISPLVVNDRQLRERAMAEDAFDARLEATGPCRLLRVLAGMTATFHLTARSAKAVVEVDLAEGLVVGAVGGRPSGETFEGTRALAALLAMGSGRVHVEKRSHPSTANVMAPVDEALARASQEAPPFAPSVPPPAHGEARAPAATGGKRRPFPNASEIGKDALLATMGSIESDHDLSGPIDAPHPALLGSAGSRSVAEDLRWDDALPRAPSRAEPGRLVPAASPRALPQGVLGAKGPSIVPRPSATSAPAKKPQQTRMMGVLRSGPQSVQGLPAVRDRPSTPSGAALSSAGGAEVSSSALVSSALAAASAVSGDARSTATLPGAIAGMVRAVAVTRSEAETHAQPASRSGAAMSPEIVRGAPLVGGPPDAAPAAPASTVLAASQPVAPPRPVVESGSRSAQVGKIAPKKTLVGVMPPRPLAPLEERTDPAILERDRRSEDSTHRFEVEPSEEAKRTSMRLPRIDASSDGEPERSIDDPSELGSAELARVLPKAAFAGVVAPASSREASASGGTPAGALPPAAPASSTASTASESASLPMPPAGALPPLSSAPLVPARERAIVPVVPRIARASRFARGIAYIMLACAAIALVGVGSMIAARRLGLTIGDVRAWAGVAESAGAPETEARVEPIPGAESPAETRGEAMGAQSSGAAPGAAEGAVGHASGGAIDGAAIAHADPGDVPVAAADVEGLSAIRAPAEAQAIGAEETIALAETERVESVEASVAGIEAARTSSARSLTLADPPVDPRSGETAAQLLERARDARGSTAESYYRRVLSLDPHNHYAMSELARLLLARGAATEARPLAQEAVRRRGRRAPYRVLLGDVLQALGDSAGAHGAWEAALEIEPTNRDALRRLGR